MTIQRNASLTRMLLACVIIIGAAYWAGARWGQRQPIGVDAVQRVNSGPNALSATNLAARRRRQWAGVVPDRKSTRLNSSHQIISYAVFCLKTKNKIYT